MPALRPQYRLIALLATVGLLTAGCGDTGNTEGKSNDGAETTTVSTIDNSPDSIATASFAPSLGVDIASSQHNSGGLYWRDLKVGTGAEVKNGQTVSVHYRGSLPDGTQFDASTGSPFTFQIGRGRVIAGWDQGVLGMKVGGSRQLIIPPQLGYGARGSGPIPPDAVLIFTVDVLETH